MKRHRTAWALVAALAAADCTSAAPSATPVAPEREAYLLCPGVLVDPVRRWVWAAVADGGIAALDAASGTTRFASPSFDEPLYLEGRSLVVRARAGDGRLGLAILDADRPAGALATRELELPPGVRAPPGLAPNETFAARARRSSQGVVVEWAFARYPTTGIAPREGEPDGVERAHGAALVDLAARRIAAAEPWARPSELPESPPPAVEQAYASGAAVTAPARVDGLWTIVTLRDPQTRSGLVLQRWDATGRSALPSVELTAGPFHLVTHSADGRHLSISRRDAPDSATLHVWSIHDAASGAPIGRASVDLPGAAFAVLAGTLLYERPLSGRLVNGAWQARPRALEALSLPDGRPLWTRELVDPAPRRAPPPAS